MSLDEFRLAQCELFRTPPVDLKRLEAALNEAMFSAWKRGADAQRTVDSILSSESIVSQISQQIAKSHGYQQMKALDALSAEEAEKKRVLQEKREAEILAIKNQYTAKLQEQKAQLDATLNAYDKSTQEYLCAQGQLDESRAKVAAQLKEIGGEEGLAKILELDAMLEEPLDEKQKKAADQSPQQSPQSQSTPETNVDQYAAQTAQVQESNLESNSNQTSDPADITLGLELLKTNATAEQLASTGNLEKIVKKAGPVKKKKGFIKRTYYGFLSIFGYKGGDS
ncbi:MAG TPA: hypothetical protein VK158_03125 [Acidobacteriota bacterium]|nr:hypothetical protein [Acidobacteriota bacterium]